ncbi:Probable serine/threonine-protein kinase PBL8 [Linum perenne]
MGFGFSSCYGVDLSDLATANLIIYPDDVIRNAKRANNVLGHGGYGTVYYSEVENDPVAIKVVKGGRQGIDGMRREIDILNSIRPHPNIIQLLGYCTSPAALVYEFVPGGTLCSHLHDFASHNRPPLTLTRRLNIARDMAVVLCHLQPQRGRKILYRDIKPSNILLDENFNVKLADFGMAVELHPDENELIGGTVLCTNGYIPIDGHFSGKIDVFSFGVVLVELITGMKANDPARLGRFDENLARWAAQLRTHVGIVDSNIVENYPAEVMGSTFELAHDCVQGNRHDRPTPQEILDRLNEIIRTYGGE